MKELQDLKNEKMQEKLTEIYSNANCTNCPPEWFFPHDGVRGKTSVKPGSNLYNAFTTCNECKVKQQCFDFAKDYKCVGVWGGRLFTYSRISKLKIRDKQT